MARRVNTQFLTILAVVIVGGGALIYFLQLVLIHEHSDKYVERAKTEMKDQQWNEAIIDLSHAAALDPRDPEIQVQLGHALYGKAQTDPQSFLAEKAAFQRALDINPNYVPALNALLEWYKIFLAAQPSASLYREAIDYARHAQQLSPGDVHAAALPDQLLIQQWVANLQIDDQQVANAMSDLRTLMQQHPEDSELPFTIARVKVEQGQRIARPTRIQPPGATQAYAEAVKVFEDVLGPDGKGPQADNAMIHCRFAQLLEYLSDVDASAPGTRAKYLARASAEFDRSRALSRPKDEFYLGVNQFAALFAQRRNDYETAINIYRSLPDSPRNRVDLAEVLGRSAKTRPEGEHLMETTLASLGDDPNHFDGARVTLTARLMEMRISDYTEASDPVEKQRLHDLIQSTLDKLNSAVGSRNPLDVRRAEGHFQIVTAQYELLIDKLTRLASDPTVLKDEPLQMMLATAYDHAHQTSKAVEVLAQIVDQYPRDVRARKEYVRLLLRENPDLAKLQMDDLERIDPDDADLKLYRLTLSGQSGEGTSALVDYASLREVTLEEIRKKATVAAALKNWDEASRLFAMVVDKDPKDSEAWVYLVKIQMTQDKRADALKSAQAGLQVNPDNGKLKVIIAAIEGNDPEVVQNLIKEDIKSNPDKVKGELALADLAAQQGDNKTQEEHLAAARVLAPENPEVLSALFDFYIGTKRPDDAAALLPALTAGNFDSANGAIYRLHMAQAKGDAVTAMQIAQQLSHDKPDFAFSWVALGDVLQTQKQYDQAITQYAIALQKQSSNAQAYQGIANCDYALNKPADALRNINEGLSKQPNNAVLRQMLVVHQLNYGSPREAIAGLRSEIRQSPNNPGLVSALGDCMLRQAREEKAAGNAQQASNTIQQAMAIMNEALAKWPDDAPLYLSMADAAITDGKKQLTEQILQTWAARQTWKNTPEPHIELARYYEDNQQPDRSEAELKTAMTNSKDRLDLEIAVVDLFRSHKKYDDALQVLRTTNRDNPTVRAKAIEILQLAGKSDEAEKEIKSQLASHPANSATLLTLWSSLLLNSQHYNEAAQRADEALALLPNDSGARYCRGRARLRTDPPDPKGALDDLYAVAASTKGNPQICLDLAAAYLQMELPDKATSELESALHIDPKNKQARMMLVQIYQSQTPPRLNEALSALRPAENMPMYANDPDIYQSEAVLLGELNDLPTALQKSEKALSLSPGDQVLVRSNLELLIKATKYSDALKRIDALPPESKAKWWAAFDRGQAEKGLNHPQAALDDMAAAMQITQQATDKQPADDVSFAKIADQIARDFGNDRAIAAVQTYAPTSMRARLMLAVLYHLNAQDPSAVAAIDADMKGIDKLSRPQQLMLLSTAAQLYQTAAPTPLVDRANEAYRRWLAIDPHNTTALNNYAWLLADQYAPPRLTEALQFIQKAVDEMNRAGRQEPKLLDTNGWLLIQSGAIAEGVNILNKVIELKPFPEAYLHHGEGMLKMTADGSLRTNYVQQAKKDAQLGLTMLGKMDVKDQDAQIKQKLQDLANRSEDLLKPKQQAQVPQ